jgi:hypothetical protein
MEIAVSSLDVVEVVSMKVCKKCRQELPLSAFGKYTAGNGGVYGSCRKCRNPEPTEETLALRAANIPEFKLCKSCGITKSSEEFGVQGTGRYKGIIRSNCKACDVAKSQKWNQDNRDKFNSNCNAYYYRHRERLLSEPYAKKRLEKGNEWYLLHPEVVTRKAASRRAAKLTAIPSWADNVKIQDVYTECHRVLTETGIKSVVDHMVPLRSPYVCGLHVHYNLTPLDPHENAKKHNIWWPDMWEITPELRKIAREFKKQNA